MARPGLMRHRKFLRLARAVGSTFAARGILEILWDHGNQASDDYLGTVEDIESLVGWTGERGGLTSALVAAGGADRHGFIEPIDDASGSPEGTGATTATRYRIHDFADHPPDALMRHPRRWRERLLQRRGEHLQQICCTEPQICGTDAHDAQLSPPTPPHDVRTPSLFSTEEEKRKTDQGVQVPGAGAARDDAATVAVFPVVGRRGSAGWPLTQAQVDEWQHLYPQLDILCEVCKALAWVRANPGHRKTWRGMPTFLVNWLNRAVNRGGSRQVSTQARAASPYGAAAAQNRAFLARRRSS